jgi:hypothetical protein
MRSGGRALTSSLIVVILITGCLSIQSPAQTNQAKANGNVSKTVSTNGLAEPKAPDSEMRGAIERYAVDRGTLTRS